MMMRSHETNIGMYLSNISIHSRSLYFRYASDGEEQTVLESMRDYLLSTIQKTFEVGIDQAECLYQELLQCTRNKNLVILSFIICYSALHIKYSPRNTNNQVVML